MRIPLDRESSVPLYQQIRDFLRREIQRGGLVPETRLPPTRELAAALGVNRLTVATAYAELEAEGLIYAHVGRGTFVASPPQSAPAGIETGTVLQVGEWPSWQRVYPRPLRYAGRTEIEHLLTLAANPGVISFAQGTGASDLFPVTQFRQAMNEVLRRDKVDALGYGERAGYPPLRLTIARVLASQGLAASPNEIIVTTGSQQALDLVARTLLRPGDPVLVESPTYSGALEVFEGVEARLVAVPMDEEGMRVEVVEELIQYARPRLIYTIPTFHNPTGTSLDNARRRQLVALSARYNIPILEDDFVGDLRYDGPAQPALKTIDTRGNVIYVSTFSKMLMPGLRIGFLVASGPIYDHLLIRKRTTDLATSNLIQRALETYITVGRYQTHLRRTRRIYRQRRDVMVQCLREQCPAEITWNIPGGGLFIWVRLPGSVSVRQLYLEAIQERVAFLPGTFLFPGNEEYPAIRLNFTVHPPDVIVEGMRRLGRVLERFLARAESEAVPPLDQKTVVV